LNYDLEKDSRCIKYNVRPKGDEKKMRDKAVKGGEKMNFWTVAAVVISLLSAAFAAYSTYRTTLSPFDLRIAVGHPLMGRSTDEKNEHYSLTPIIPVEFLNLGAKAGEVRDIVIVVSTGSSKWLLQGELFCKTFGVEAMREEFREVIHPFVLNGKERLFKSILFNPGKQPESWKVPMMKPNEPLPDGTYIFDFYVNAGDNNRLRLVSTKKYNMPKDIVLQIATNKGGVYFPFDDSLVHARQSFEDTLSQKP
jgi:hypothetical protein